MVVMPGVCVVDHLAVPATASGGDLGGDQGSHQGGRMCVCVCVRGLLFDEFSIGVFAVVLAVVRGVGEIRGRDHRGG